MPVMIDQATLNSLEFPVVLNFLADFCNTYLGRKSSLSLKPLIQCHEIENRLIQVEEFIAVRSRKGNLSFHGIGNPTIVLNTLSKAGSVLSSEQICQIRSILILSSDFKDYLSDIQQDAPLLTKLSRSLEKNPSLLVKINKAIGKDCEILDNASITLRKIRISIHHLRDKIYNSLEKILNSTDKAYLFQDRIITQRNQRYVIPVRTEQRSHLKGIIHDQSASGATLFIEPLSILPLNNSLIQERLAEQKEIINILKNLTNSIREHKEVLIRNVDAVTELDLIQAKAFLALKLNANRPKIVKIGKFELLEARHPLLIHYLGREKTVPIDLKINEKEKILLISGPNMGGKTVALKTAGLLSLMVQSGLLVPTSYNSTFPIFHSIFTDIGDQQDLSKSLSTFAAHILRLKKILDEAGKASLVLLDELGGGTDPDEGAAIGEMILDEMKQRKALTIATTHLNNLKQKTLSEATEMSASVQFDAETGKPTYKLIYGQSGKSNALKIAENLGIDETYIIKAKNKLSPLQVKLQEMIAEQKKMQTELSEKEDKLNQEFKKVARLRKKARRAARKERQKALNEAEQLLEQIRQRVRFIHNELSKVKLKPAVVNDVIVNEVKEKIKEIEEIVVKENIDAKPIIRSLKVKYTPAVGDFVSINNISKTGQIMKIFNQQKLADVAISGKIMKAPFDAFVQVNKKIRKEMNEPVVSVERHSLHDNPPDSQLKLLGKRVDVALDLLDHYIDDAILGELRNVKIIHGIGKEKLRPAIHAFLKTHPLVANFHSGNQLEGGFGVTVVQLDLE